uniref:Uncharacterized protein n=2 Tax=Moniliophthora roreri TaxID=221103 RepID=A0A0W0FY72_MONRR
MSSKTSPDEPVVIKLEKGAMPSAPKPKVKCFQASKATSSCIIVFPPVLNKEDPPVASTFSKGKSKATPLSTNEDDELDESDRSEDIYNSIKILAPGVQGQKLTEKTDFVDCILKYFGLAQALLNALKLIYQASSICCNISLYTSLLETQACLDDQLVSLSHSINISQDAFKKCIVDPYQILQSLLFLDPSFNASNAQVASLCAGFGWSSSDLLLHDPLNCGYKLYEISHISNSPFHIFVKGTDINITSKKGSEWEINDKDLVVPKTLPDTATTAKARSLQSMLWMLTSLLRSLLL